MKLALFLTAITLLASTAFADELLLNPSFESNSFSAAGGFTQLGSGSTGITDWTVINNAVAYGENPGTGYNAYDGSAFLDLTGIGTESPYGGVQQGIATTIGDTYYFGFAEAIDGAAGDHPVASADGVQLVLTEGSTSDGWTEEFASFVATNSTTQIAIYGVGYGNQSNIMFIDGLRASSTPLASEFAGGIGQPGSESDTASVPEPTTLLMFASGLVGVVVRARRKKV